jgi:hypothetical protein
MGVTDVCLFLGVSIFFMLNLLALATGVSERHMDRYEGRPNKFIFEVVLGALAYTILFPVGVLFIISSIVDKWDVIKKEFVR